MAKGSVTEFDAYLIDQIGQPYVWGAQHLKLTPANYVEQITRRESNEQHRKDAIAYCKAKFDAGATVLYAYDCSGLGMFWLENVKGIYDHDMAADGMIGKCDIVSAPKNGYWLFRVNEDGKATHIGYMVSDTEYIESKGRKYGVVKGVYAEAKSDWHVIGKPKCMDFNEPQPAPQPTEKMIKVKGSVRVRVGNGTKYKQIKPTVNKATCPTGLLPYMGKAPYDPYWYRTIWQGHDGYISSKPQYTELVDVPVRSLTMIEV